MNIGISLGTLFMTKISHSMMKRSWVYQSTITLVGKKHKNSMQYFIMATALNQRKPFDAAAFGDRKLKI